MIGQDTLGAHPGAQFVQDQLDRDARILDHRFSAHDFRIDPDTFVEHINVNAFSKKLENHAHMVALYALSYNFVRIHKTLRTTPAMAAGIETRLWSMEDVVALIDEYAERRATRLADQPVR